MLKRIAVENLKVGMHVVNIGLAGAEYPRLYAVEGIIRSEREIRAIQKEGYQDVFIETEEAHNLNCY